MERQQQRRRWPWGLGVLLIFFTIFLIFWVQAWSEKLRQTKPVTYLFDQPATVPFEPSGDWLRGAVWIKPQLSAWSAAFSPDGLWGDRDLERTRRQLTAHVSRA